MANNKLRSYSRDKSVYLWEVANALRISEATMTRKLRLELSREEISRIMSVIDEISKRKESEV
ncbi:MAG: hypothetical protein IJJ00_02975 [Erysipelotrichaceae bacterium]|nr:hypothetical protein [Erysipelotrichaceae bacterium]